MDENNDKLSLLFKCFRDSLIGKNARGIIHNINSPLQVMSMQVEFLRMDFLRLQEKTSTSEESGMEEDRLREVSDLLQKGFGRLAQVEDMLQRINIMVAIIAARVGKADENTEGTPVMLNQLLEEQIEFWRSDLFFKHKVSLSVNLPDISPIIVLREDILRDTIDGIIFGCLEQIRREPGPQIEIRCAPVSAADRKYRILFSQNGPLFPVADIENRQKRLAARAGKDLSIFEDIPQGHFSLLLASVLAGITGLCVEIRERQITVNI